MAEAARPTRLALALALIVVGPGCSAPPDAPEAVASAAEPTSEVPQPQVEYQVAIDGVEDAALRELLESVSETVGLVERPPPSLIRLRRRAADDR